MTAVIFTSSITLLSVILTQIITIKLQQRGLTASATARQHADEVEAAHEMLMTADKEVRRIDNENYEVAQDATGKSEHALDTYLEEPTTAFTKLRSSATRLDLVARPEVREASAELESAVENIFFRRWPEPGKPGVYDAYTSARSNLVAAVSKRVDVKQKSS